MSVNVTKKLKKIMKINFYKIFFYDIPKLYVSWVYQFIYKFICHKFRCANKIITILIIIYNLKSESLIRNILLISQITLFSLHNFKIFLIPSFLIL